MENFENACHLYNENGLELEELMCKLNLMNEACHVLIRMHTEGLNIRK